MGRACSMHGGCEKCIQILVGKSAILILDFISLKSKNCKSLHYALFPILLSLLPLTYRQIFSSAPPSCYIVRAAESIIK
jgi:hypothetical protein